MPDKKDEMATFFAPDRKSWRRWLERNSGTSKGVCLVIYKKGTGKPGVSYNDAVEEALAFGWIDSRGNRLDEERFKLMFTQRKPGSVWAKTNKERVKRLMKAGLMAPAGLEKVAAAKRGGSWSAYDDIERLRFPEDLVKALARNPEARAFFNASLKTYKKQALYWIKSAKRPETRARRIAEVVRMAAEREMANR